MYVVNLTANSNFMQQRKKRKDLGEEKDVDAAKVVWTDKMRKKERGPTGQGRLVYLFTHQSRIEEIG